MRRKYEWHKKKELKNDYTIVTILPLHGGGEVYEVDEGSKRGMGGNKKGYKKKWGGKQRK